KESTEKYRCKETNVYVSSTLNFKTGFPYHLFQLFERVTAPVIADIVLHAPQKHKRRHKQKCMPARTQHAPHLFQTGQIVIKVLYYIKTSGQIKRSVVVWQSFRRAQFHLL